MVMLGRGITKEKQFIREALSCMREFMTIDGNKVVYDNFIESESQITYFSRIVDRQVSRSMNDLIFQAKVYLCDCQKLPFDVSFILNKSPMSYLKYSNPKVEFRKLYITKDGDSPNNNQIKDNVISIKDYRQLKTKH